MTNRFYREPISKEKKIAWAAASTVAFGAFTVLYFSGKNNGESARINPPSVENSAEYDIRSGLTGNNSRLPIEGLHQKTTQSDLEKEVDVYSMNDANYDAHIRKSDDYAFGLMGSYLDTDELRNTLGLEYFAQTTGEYLDALRIAPLDEVMKYTPQSFWESHPELFEEINNFEIVNDSLEDIIKIPGKLEIESSWTPEARENFARMRESELLGGYSESIPHLANLGNFSLSTDEEGNINGVSRQYEEFVLDQRTTHEIAVDKFEGVFDYLERTASEGESLESVREEIELYQLQEAAVNGASTKHNYVDTIEEKWEMDEKLDEISSNLNNAFSKILRSRLKGERKNFRESLGTEGRRILSLKELCEEYYTNKENAELSQMAEDDN